MWNWLARLFGGNDTPLPAPEPAPDRDAMDPVKAPPSKPSDPYYVVRPLFDLLGKSEGTDKGDGYNETLSYGAYTGGDVNLVGMTLREVDLLQTAMLAHSRNKLNSSACGRYQIVRTTLRALKKTLDVDDDVKFNAECQDLMCFQLLRERGLELFLKGSLSANGFLNNLAKEWASIPTTKGTGYYGNQSRTPVTATQVRTVLAEVKQRAGKE